MITVMSIAEISIGETYRKGLLRMVGTVLGAACGIFTLYFAVLCNGLSHENHPLKVCVGVFVGLAFDDGKGALRRRACECRGAVMGR